MAQGLARYFTLRTRDAGVLAALTASLMLSACAGASDVLPSATAPLASNDVKASGQDANAELRQATDYWGKQYKAKPEDRTAAVSYAKNLRAMGDKRMALNVLQDAATFHSDDKELMGELGRLALEFDQFSLAARALEVADQPGNTDWRVISARGTLLAKQGQHKAAIPYYERALAISPNQPSVLNNLAMANAMSGDAAKAEEILKEVANKDGTPAKVNQNLALVLGLQGKYDESKATGAAAVGSTTLAAENTEYLRRMVKLDPKASPAPATAVAVSNKPLPWANGQPAAVASAKKATSTQVARANDAFKPGAIENTSSAPNWDTAVTASVQPSDGAALKGSNH